MLSLLFSLFSGLLPSRDSFGSAHLGEIFVVSGLGVIGLLTAQLLLAHGCRVLGLDLILLSVLAGSLGIDALDLSSGVDPVSWCLDHTEGVGVDGVLITASTSSSELSMLQLRFVVSVVELFLLVLQGSRFVGNFFTKRN